MTDREMHFISREDFRRWLEVNADGGEGVFLRFDRRETGSMKTAEAVEEALCFGWIDGILRKIDEFSYRVYFTERTRSSRWSAKNVDRAQRLEASGRMTDKGREKIAWAKANGSWDAPQQLPAYDEGQTRILLAAIGDHEPAKTHFEAMSPSVKRTYTLWYLDAKSPETRAKRLITILSRLDENRKPMD
ncbi:MAG TPA: YdeI/OmpD-associated family protein [Candidatus Izemoplasmatales bacterium]|nr:YdeI/OmpD-associated family protein [Bacillota bacterium]HRY77783.1 YdeI/OmpD-associated family protein [Candidatus Izemoplasmatales bacterium]